MLSAWLSPQTDSMAAANASCFAETMAVWSTQSSLDDQQGHRDVAQAPLNTFFWSSIRQNPGPSYGLLPSAVTFAGEVGESLETVIDHDTCLFCRCSGQLLLSPASSTRIIVYTSSPMLHAWRDYGMRRSKFQPRACCTLGLDKREMMVVEGPMGSAVGTSGVF